MLKTQKIKKTGQQVYVVGKSDANHTWVLFPHEQKTRAGNLGNVQSVHNSNIVDDNDQ
jgi:hypothetical protein